MAEDILNLIPALPQRQDSVSEQLVDLRRVANKMGMYDAADAIGQLFDFDRLSTLKYGCHCDIENTASGRPDDCVIDTGHIQDCIHASPGMRKEQCDYWRVVSTND